MPIKSGMGCSSFTLGKQRVFDGVLDMHTAYFGDVISRGEFNPIYRYWDLTSGAGRYVGWNRETIMGSPVRAIRHLESENVKVPATTDMMT